MLTRRDIAGRRQDILQVASRHGAFDVQLIGSVARGDARDDSDIDLVVRFKPGRSLLDHGALVMDLRELLGVSVDVLDADALGERFRRSISAEAIPL